MTQTPTDPRKERKVLSLRQLTLLGSVAALGIALLAAGPSGYLTAHFSGWSNVARPADTSSVPAVISVRVKIG